MVSVSLRVNFRVRARNIVKLKLMDQGDVTVGVATRCDSPARSFADCPVRGTIVTCDMSLEGPGHVKRNYSSYYYRADAAA